MDAQARPFSSPPKSRSGASVLGRPGLQYNSRLPPSVDGVYDDIVKKSPTHPVPKRSRSPPSGAGQISQASFFSTEDEAERELQAKAKRLARFKTELQEVEPGDSLHYGQNVARKGTYSFITGQSTNEKQKFPGYYSRSMEEISEDNDDEDSPSCRLIVGLCPDMCPESERAERERKGDLDRYERLDGDRNQTTMALAVKKYSRTAERDAELIRPMPILRKTMDYLLGLLDQPYDDRLLGLYNFLWDRMRAIRMDLRMQHIFNLEAITMLEQMMRLHILAMHELCEFSKGEGFLEGFDAHLNIEQMNKTSAELFQLYDDHRDKGICIPTEKEFRGYYALLKLDKHPGYNVEPAELSLELAKMTAEIRQTHDVRFARDVARSCRTGNFIAFFRHAKRATYLQACLMHAHFSKLRTQALASLHSGLQHNQGLPISQAAKWLGMEGEDIQTLLKYHGFSIKVFEEPYMVKEGSFLHYEKDYPTRCSILVNKKKSNKIWEDVTSSHHASVLPSESNKKFHSDMDDKEIRANFQPAERRSPIGVSGVMEMDAVSSLKNGPQVKSLFETTRIDKPYMEINNQISISSPKSNTGLSKAFSSFVNPSLQELPSSASPKDSLLDDGTLRWKSPLQNVSLPQFVPENPPAYVERPGEAYVERSSTSENLSEVPVQSELQATEPDILLADVNKLISPACDVDSGSEIPLREDILMEEVTKKQISDPQQNVESLDVVSYYDEEVAKAKLKLLIRLWRRRFARKKEFREKNRLAANAALSSLSLGPPVQQNKDKPTICRKLNIDQAVSKRFDKSQQSWARWNISDLVAAKLGEKNAKSNCIGWKLMVFSWLHQGDIDGEKRNSVHLSLDQWLQYKLIPARNDEDVHDMVLSAPGMAIWRKWVHDDLRGTSTCCLSVIKDSGSGNFEKNLLGTTAILYTVSEIVPWDIQRVQLQNLVMSLPAGASIPLLILSGSNEHKVTEMSCSIVDKLGLKDIDNSRVGSFLVKCVNERDETGHFDEYFSDEKLKEGLLWLASGTAPQPALSHVTMRELVSTHLNSCLHAHNLSDSDKLGPNSYICVFNEALDRSKNDIVTSAKMNSAGWPCPELFLLDNSTAEARVVRQCLPSLGWSSAEEVELLISALKSLELPSFSDDMSWLSRSCSSWKDIEDQRQLLQDCLIRYLTSSSNVMNLMMATKEASVMLQQCTKLELLYAEYKVVPVWLMIFRRVFSWQLNTLGSITQKAYVSEQIHSTYRFNSSFLGESKDEIFEPLSVIHPSLDEMVEVSCSPLVSKRVRSSPRSMQNVSEATSIDDTNVDTNIISNVTAENGSQNPMVHVESINSDIYVKRNDYELVPKAQKQADRLNKLLDRCNILQDEIEKKLSIYF